MDDAAAHDLSMERYRLALAALQCALGSGVPESMVQVLAFECGIPYREVLGVSARPVEVRDPPF